MATKHLLNVPGLIRSHKRSRFESVDKALMESGIRRTSGLCTPVVRLEDHQGEINACRFHPHGDLVMSAGFDKQIHIGCVYGENSVVMAMSGHTASVMEAQFSADGSSAYSCSADRTVAIWDTATGTQINVLQGHDDAVNSIQSNMASWPVVCSGSDDRTVRLWDIREESSFLTLRSGHQVTSTCFNQRGDHVISGGVDNDIKIWDIRQNAVVARLQGHVDTISGISLSPCGWYLLSNSLDNTLRIWDLRPFMQGERCVDVYTANQYIMEANLLRCAWSKDGARIAAGSSDSHVYVWDIDSHRLMYKLPGHESSVNDVDFHPTEPIVVSGSSYENLYMHELES